MADAVVTDNAFPINLSGTVKGAITYYSTHSNAQMAATLILLLEPFEDVSMRDRITAETLSNDRADAMIMQKLCRRPAKVNGESTDQWQMVD